MREAGEEFVWLNAGTSFYPSHSAQFRGRSDIVPLFLLPLPPPVLPLHHFLLSFLLFHHFLLFLHSFLFHLHFLLSFCFPHFGIAPRSHGRRVRFHFVRDVRRHRRKSSRLFSFPPSFPSFPLPASSFLRTILLLPLSSSFDSPLTILPAKPGSAFADIIPDTHPPTTTIISTIGAMLAPPPDESLLTQTVPIGSTHSTMSAFLNETRLILQSAVFAEFQANGRSFQRLPVLISDLKDEFKIGDAGF